MRSWPRCQGRHWELKTSIETSPRWQRSSGPLTKDFWSSNVANAHGSQTHCCFKMYWDYQSNLPCNDTSFLIIPPWYSIEELGGPGPQATLLFQQLHGRKSCPARVSAAASGATNGSTAIGSNSCWSSRSLLWLLAVASWPHFRSQFTGVWVRVSLPTSYVVDLGKTPMLATNVQRFMLQMCSVSQSRGYRVHGLCPFLALLKNTDAAVESHHRWPQSCDLQTSQQLQGQSPAQGPCRRAEGGIEGHDLNPFCQVLWIRNDKKTQNGDLQ